MCFTIPKKILRIEHSRAIVEGNIPIDIGHLDCSVGDYVIISSGIAIQKIEQSEAQSMRSLIKQTHDTLS